MPRTRRILPQSDAALHVTARGNNQLYLFRKDPDKAFYLHKVKELKAENRIDIFHYCLMSNHVHMVIWLQEKSNLSRFMKQLQLKYYNYYKSVYGYTGHLWQGRFKSNIIDTDIYLLQCGKYIELNPVRASMVAIPEAYAFSSYRYYAHGEQDHLITPSPEYLALSNTDKERKRQYAKFLLDNEMINTKKLQTQLFIGSDAFIRNLEEHYKVRNVSLQHGRPKKGGK